MPKKYHWINTEEQNPLKADCDPATDDILTKVFTYMYSAGNPEPTRVLELQKSLDKRLASLKKKSGTNGTKPSCVGRQFQLHSLRIWLLFTDDPTRNPRSLSNAIEALDAMRTWAFSFLEAGLVFRTETGYGLGGPGVVDRLLHYFKLDCFLGESTHARGDYETVLQLRSQCRDDVSKALEWLETCDESCQLAYGEAIQNWANLATYGILRIRLPFAEQMSEDEVETTFADFDKIIEFHETRNRGSHLLPGDPFVGLEQPYRKWRFRYWCQVLAKRGEYERALKGCEHAPTDTAGDKTSKRLMKAHLQAVHQGKDLKEVDPHFRQCYGSPTSNNLVDGFEVDLYFGICLADAENRKDYRQQMTLRLQFLEVMCERHGKVQGGQNSIFMSIADAHVLPLNAEAADVFVADEVLDLFAAADTLIALKDMQIHTHPNLLFLHACAFTCRLRAIHGSTSGDKRVRTASLDAHVDSVVDRVGCMHRDNAAEIRFYASLYFRERAAQILNDNPNAVRGKLGEIQMGDGANLPHMPFP